EAAEGIRRRRDVEAPPGDDRRRGLVEERRDLDRQRVAWVADEWDEPHALRDVVELRGGVEGVRELRVVEPERLRRLLRDDRGDQPVVRLGRAGHLDAELARDGADRQGQRADAEL